MNKNSSGFRKQIQSLMFVTFYSKNITLTIPTPNNKFSNWSNKG